MALDDEDPQYLIEKMKFGIEKTCNNRVVNDKLND